MNRKLIFFLLANIPVSIGLHILLLNFTMNLWYGQGLVERIITWPFVAICFLLTLFIDIIILRLGKLLSAKSFCFTLAEIIILYIPLIWRYYFW
jgi:hypothetical protein